MSKVTKDTKVTMMGPFTDAAGQTHEQLSVSRGNVFYNAEQADHVSITVIGEGNQEVTYTAPQDETVYASLINAHASYRPEVA